MAVFVLALAALNHFFAPLDPGFGSMRPHPYLIGIALAASFYGLPAGVLVALLAAVALIAQLVLAGRPLDAVLADSIVHTHVAWFFGAGYALGVVRRVLADHMDHLSRRVAETTKRAASFEEQAQTLKIAKTELEQRIVGQTASVHSLYEAVKGLESLRREELHEALLRVAARFTGASRVSLWLAEPNSENLRLALTHGWTMPQPPLTLQADPGVVGTAHRSRRVVTVNEWRGPRDKSAEAHAPGYTSVMAAPLGAAGAPYGVLSVEAIPFERLSLSTVRILGMLAELAGTAIDNALAHEQASEERPADPSTRLFRHQYAMKRLIDECSRSRRYRLPTSLLLVIAEDAGSPHVWNADAVRPVTDVLRQSTRTVDLVAHGPRPGEFVVLLPLTDLAGAAITADRISKGLAMASPSRSWQLVVAARRDEEAGDALYQRVRKTLDGSAAAEAGSNGSVIIAD